MPGLAAQELIIADGCAVSFEDEAARIEYEICKVRGVVCVCCAGNELPNINSHYFPVDYLAINTLNNRVYCV